MSARIGSVTAAMIAIAALTVLLGVEAERTARGHQATAARVLVDYAGLGAEGVATRLQAFLGSRLFPILDQAKNPPPPTRAAFAAGLDLGVAALAAQAQWVGRVASTGPIRAVRYDTLAPIPAELADSIRVAGRRLPMNAYFGMFAQGAHLIVFAPLRGTPGSAAAYALPLAAIQADLRSFLDKVPVLPPALLHDTPLADRAAVTLSLGGQRLAARGSADSSRFLGVHSLGPMFGGMTVEVRLKEELASSLVIGGLPGSRLPYLAAVMALTITLAVLSVRQVRQRERLAQLREDFVAGASHELRTPLAQIRLFAETLRLGRVRTEEERDHAIAVMEREARRLEHLVENLLNSSRSRQGNLTVSLEPVDLGALTREVVDEYAPLARKAGIEIDLLAPRSLTAHADPAAWRQIVLNLVDNATKYGGRGSRVTVALESDTRGNRLTVSDQGPGVPPSERERIWKRFWRGESARAAGVTGTGVGLATVKHLVALMNGDCWVESVAARGARFVVQMPVDP